MTVFLLTIITVYGGAHVYAFFRARSAFGFGTVPGVLLALFMALMVAAPFVIRALELHEYERTARVFAYIAYLWMAALFLFFCSSLTIDLVNLGARAVRWIARADLPLFPLPARTSFLISLGLALAICIYGYVEANNIRTQPLRIETAKLPAGIDKLTIVQMSDVHLGLIIRCDRLEKMLEVVKAANPDILVVTGDLVDAQINHLTGLADLLRGVNPRYGKFAITGNHEYYAGLEKALNFTRNAGFTVLRNEAIKAGPIMIAGVDDRTALQLKLARPVSERELLAALPRDKFILFLKHQPRIDRSTIGLFDLQLSGHTH
ncbi:MAG TPA: metallophosphoesterase, partial [Nitrospirota bacterium]